MPQVLAFIHHYQYWGVFLVQSLGVMGIPMPDDSTLVLLGYLAHKQVLRFEWTVAAAFLGNACGSTVAFFLGRAFGVLLIARLGSRIGLTPEKVERTHSWFRRLGKWLLVVGYFIPGVRHIMCYLVGASKLEYPVFAVFAYAGSLIWTSTFVYAGTVLGSHWARLAKAWGPYWVQAGVIAALLALVTYFFWQYFKNKKNKTRQVPEP